MVVIGSSIEKLRAPDRVEHSASVLRQVEAGRVEEEIEAYVADEQYRMVRAARGTAVDAHGRCKRRRDRGLLRLLLQQVAECKALAEVMPATIESAENIVPAPALSRTDTRQHLQGREREADEALRIARWRPTASKMLVNLSRF